MTRRTTTTPARYLDWEYEGVRAEYSQAISSLASEGSYDSIASIDELLEETKARLAAAVAANDAASFDKEKRVFDSALKRAVKAAMSGAAPAAAPTAPPPPVAPPAALAPSTAAAAPSAPTTNTPVTASRPAPSASLAGVAVVVSGHEPRIGALERRVDDVENRHVVFPQWLAIMTTILVVIIIAAGIAARAVATAVILACTVVVLVILYVNTSSRFVREEA